MMDILHRVGIESASLDDVYDALTTLDGLSEWWTTDTTRHHRCRAESSSSGSERPAAST